MFRLILDQLLATCGGSLAVMFCDYEGEMVELVCDRDLSDHDLRIIGAYHAIYLTKLRNMCEQMDTGKPQRFKLEFEATKMLSYDLKDGYYVVLLVAPDANEGIAWQSLRKCQERLLAEM